MSFTPTQEDWVRANRLWFKHPSGLVRWYRPLGFAMLGLGALSVLANLLLTDRALVQAIGDAAIMLVAGTTLLTVRRISNMFIPGQVRRQFA